MDLLTGKKLSSNQLANKDLIHWSVSLFSWKGGVGIVILVSCEYYFIRVHENMVQHPSYNISITTFKIASRELTSRGFTVEFKA